MGGVEYEICFPLGRVIEMVPYAVAGLIFSKYDIFAKIKRYRYFVLGISVLLLYMFKKHIDLPAPKGFQYQGLDLFFISILAFTFFMLFPWEYITDRCKRILSSMGKNTNGIYYVHMLIGIILQFLIRKCGLPYQTFYSCVIVYVVSYLVICIIRKIPLNLIKWIS